MGIILLGIAGLYLLVSLGAVIGAMAYAGKTGKRVARWGWSAALVMYLIPFWDWIPTVAVHQYYCATEAGFSVYKTLDQWKKENPGVMEGLHQILQPSQRMPYGHIDVLDQRFAIETHRRVPVPLLSTEIAERLLVDRTTGVVLAKGIDIGSGYGNPTVGVEHWQGYKFWLRQTPCTTKGIWNLSTEIQNMRSKK
jgi:hypothetical protein